MSTEHPDSPDPADAAEVPVDTEPLERAQSAIDEGHEAAAKALDPDEPDVDFDNTKTNTDPDAEDNAVPRPS